MRCKECVHEELLDNVLVPPHLVVRPIVLQQLRVVLEDDFMGCNVKRVFGFVQK